MIAVLIVLAAASAPPAASTAKAKADAYASEEVAYAKSIQGRSQWRLTTLTDNLMIFTKPYGEASGPNPKLWMRAEHYPLAIANPLGAAESFISVHEIDCAAKRDRTISSTLYSGPEMGGNIVGASDQPNGWQPVAPDSTIGRASVTLCAAHLGSPASVAPPSASGHTPPSSIGQGRP